MPTVWFIIVSVMIAAYVVLDGFDLGAGIIYLFAGRSSQDSALHWSGLGWQ
jgi:cytochrome bd ubiquinol oxidase subunit II